MSTAIDSMFERLSEIPLFRGASKDLMERTVGMAKFHFLKYASGQTIVSAGEPCSHARFILDGSVRISIVNADERFRIGQTLTGPDVISPDFLFGHTTLYPRHGNGDRSREHSADFEKRPHENPAIRHHLPL